QAGLQGVINRTRGRLLHVDVERQSTWKLTWHTVAVDAIAAKVCRRDLGLAGLIDIAEAEESRAFRAHVPDLEHCVVADGLLHIQIEILNVRRRQALARTEKLTRRRRAGKYRRIG